jgi:ArsR family transcriptional regulator, arsenate/arsenite/antimonite-responsive transcriptional repressor
MKKESQSILKALSDDTRLSIVLFLSSRFEASCGEISSGLSELTQPTISHHFKVLTDAGVVSVRKEGVTCHYSLEKKFLKEHGIDVQKLFQDDILVAI